MAARLEQAAEPGEVLIGAETLALVGATVKVGDERLLELKGKSEPVSAVCSSRCGERSGSGRTYPASSGASESSSSWTRGTTPVAVRVASS